MTWKASVSSYNRRTQRYEQGGTLTNTSRQPIPGPVLLVLDDLSRNTRLFNTTGYLPPQGSPYVEVTGREGLAPGASVSVRLEFVNPSYGPITYKTRVLAVTDLR